MSIPKKIWLLVIGLLLIAGVGFTLWDYKNWRWEETHKFGQGGQATSEFLPAMKLEGVFSNRIRGVRIKYPKSWDVGEMEFREPFGRAKVSIKVKKDTANLSDIADSKAFGVTRERDYLDANGLAVTILTWDGESQVKQVALAKKGDRLVMIEIICESGAWKIFSKTFEAMYRTLVVL